ncbi:MAG: hypothetical protein AB1918_09240 [Pseudomonadota bacterium]
MTDSSKGNGAMTPDKAKAEARKQAEHAKFIIARIKAAKAKRQASRPKPRVQAD